MPYNFTHKWNVMNKSNQAKTSTYAENKILGTRGMGWAQGQMGEEGQLNGDKWKLQCVQKSKQNAVHMKFI